MRIAIIGAGFMGRTHATSIYKGEMGATVSHVVATRQERAEALAGELPGEVVATTDYAAVLADPTVDAVSICTPTPLHLEQVRQAADAGKHVLCEKPLTLTVADAEAMIAHCRERGVTLMIAHVLRFWPEYVEAVRLVQEGAIGRLRQISCVRLGTGPDWASDSWFTDVARSGGAVVDLAIHDFDFIRQLAGMPLRTQAMGDPFNVVAQFELADGVLATVESGNRMPTGWAFRMSFRLVGDAGVVEFDGTGGVLKLTRDGAQAEHAVSGSRTFNRNVASADIDGYYYQLAEFVACIREGRPPAQGRPEDARDALDIALQVRAAL